MTEKPTVIRSTRRAFVRSLVQLGKVPLDWTRLNTVDALVGLGVAIVIASLLVGYQFQTIPDYRLGDVADRTIEAPHDFTVEDRGATLKKQEEVIEKVPGVFNLDLKVNSRIESQLRSSFARARDRVTEEKKKPNVSSSRPLSKRARQDLLPELTELVPRLNRGEALRVCLDHEFDPELENQMVKLLREALKYPGVVLSRDTLSKYRNRGILLRHTLTGQSDILKDWLSIQDLGQARDVLRLHQYELTGLSEVEKRQIISFLDGWVVPNLNFNQAETQIREQRARQEVEPVMVQVKKGRSVVREGDEIGAEELALLEVLKERKQPRRLVGEFSGIFFLVCFFLFGLWHYLIVHRKEGEGARRSCLLVILAVTVTLIVTKVFLAVGDAVAESVKVDPTLFYLFAPFALVSLLTILLLDVNLAVLCALVFSVFVVLLTRESMLLVYSLAGSMTAVYALEQYWERSAIVKAGLAIGGVNLLSAAALQFYLFPTGPNWVSVAIWASGGLVSGLISAMLASLLLPVLESLFDITTDIRLLELSNLNQPVLRRLAVEAPGTYHHSLAVGTLAEAAAEAIGANALLTRVGAYYHDIGKMKKPEYYVENQIYVSNKHESLSPNMSSLVIASHVKDGLVMAEAIGLAPVVRDLIPQHHGTRLMTYFYQKARDTAGEKPSEVSENDFRYPGPKPRSKEAAILMLADQVEAAARTLQDPNPGQIRSMIKRLIQSTIQDGQFNKCDITMSELEGIAQSFERTITTMYHHRIEYPGFDFTKEIEEKRPSDQSIQ